MNQPTTLLSKEQVASRILEYPSDFWEAQYELGGLTDLQKVQVVVQSYNEKNWIARKKPISKATGISVSEIPKLVKQLPITLEAAFDDDGKLRGRGYWLEYMV